MTSSIKNTTLGLWLALILLLLIIGVSAWMMRSFNAVSKFGRETTDGIFLLNDVFDHLQDAETGQRGYILTGSAEYRKPYDDAMKTLDPLLAKMHTHFATVRPNKMETVQRMEASIDKKRKELALTLSAFGAQGREAALWSIGDKDNAGLRDMEDIRRDMEELKNSLLADRGDVIKQSTAIRQASFATILGGSGILFLIVASSTTAIQRGIRRQEQLLEARRISEENLAVTLASIGDGLIVTDKDNRITMINHVTARLSGWSETEAQGKPIEEVFHIINESTREKVPNPAEQANRENKIVELANHTLLISRNGGEIFIDDSAAPIRDKEGNVRGAILVFRDVTIRKQAQKAQAALNVRLRRAMAETHHRVKNNLQVIASLVEVHLADGTPTVSAEALMRVKQHVVALATIHDLLTQEAKERGDADSLQTRDVLEKLRPLLSNIVGSRTLHFDIADLRLPIRQGTSLAVLINEIVSNSVKHGDGDIEIVLSQPDDKHGRLEVRDHGKGFPADFDPSKASNTGLELIDSLGRWDLHGKIEFNNHPSGGAQVMVTFPLDLPLAPANEH